MAVLVREKVLGGFSVEFDALAERAEGNVRVIERARLRGLGIVDVPAYIDARLEIRQRAGRESEPYVEPTDDGGLSGSFPLSNLYLSQGEAESAGIRVVDRQGRRRKVALSGGDIFDLEGINAKTAKSRLAPGRSLTAC